MRQRLNRYRARPAGPEIYWRRRVIALAVGMAVFGLVAWAVNGTLSGSASSPTAAATRPGGQPAGGTAAGTTATSAVTASPAASGHPSQQAVPGSRRGSGTGHRPGGRAACPAGDVVLSLHQRHASYSRGAWPFFTAEVISTDAQPCTFSTGPRSVSVMVRAGRSALWDSADCAGGTGPRSAILTRGVPAVLSFRWDRRTASPGCRGYRRPARPGAYQATAVSGSVTSNSLIFALSGSGAAVP